MESRFLSLIYPSEEAFIAAAERRSPVHITEAVCDELGLTELFRLKSGSLTDFFTADPDVILYRQATMRDLLANRDIRETLGKVRPILDDIRELRRLDRDATSTADSYLYSITEIELYVSAIEALRAGFGSPDRSFDAPAFRSLADFVRTFTGSDYYKELNKKLSELSSHVHEVKSITVGVNLDDALRPCSAGVISVNSESFHSGKTLDKILRLSFKNDAFTCISEISPFGVGQSDNKREALIGAFNGAIEDVFRSSVRGWRGIVGQYVAENTDFLLKLLPEIEFVTRAAELIETLSARPGCRMSMPILRPIEEKAFRAVALFNPRVALAIDDEIVPNDFAFDDEGRFYVLTGPNRGGKSVITVALGAAQAFCQLGLPVPAAEAEISPADGIFTHFPEGADDTIDKGRLGEECARLREIFDVATENSLILLDESLSSTGAFEASYIASEILAGFSVLRARGIFSTHLHELAAGIGEINRRAAEHGGVRIDTLVAGMEEGKRSFRIVRAKPDGKSYARDIANKYGLSFDDLMNHTEKKS